MLLILTILIGILSLDHKVSIFHHYYYCIILSNLFLILLFIFYYIHIHINIAYVRRRVWKKEISDPNFYSIKKSTSGNHSHQITIPVKTTLLTDPSLTSHSINTITNINSNTTNKVKTKKTDEFDLDSIKQLIEQSSFHFLFKFPTESNSNSCLLNITLIISLPLLSNYSNFSQVNHLF